MEGQQGMEKRGERSGKGTEKECGRRRGGEEEEEEEEEENQWKKK
jgi:hypothetical protein